MPKPIDISNPSGQGESSRLGVNNSQSRFHVSWWLNEEDDIRIVVLGGSPKAEKSVTLQYVRYAAKKHPDHTFQVLEDQMVKPVKFIADKR